MASSSSTTSSTTAATHNNSDPFEFLPVSEELKCAICFEPFHDPIELAPCGHLFCKACVQTLSTCPGCRARITNRVEPNRIIKNMASEARLRCTVCGWTGTRDTKSTHDPSQCRRTVAGAAATVVMATSASPMQPPPPPQQQQQPQQAFNNHLNVLTPPTNSNNMYFANSVAPVYYAQQYPPQYQPSGGYPFIPPNLQQQQPVGFGMMPPPPPGFYSPQPQPTSGGVLLPPNGGPTYSNPPSGYHYAPPRVIRSDGPTPWVAFKMTQEDYDQLFSIFMTFDEDDSGALDKKELSKLAKCFNFAQQPGDIERMFQEMDVDRSGTLSFDELCTWVSVNKPDPRSLYGMSQSEYNTVLFQFRTYDVNHDGCLELEEFQRLCVSLKYYDARRAAEVFRTIDLDRSGTVDLNEFLRFRAATLHPQLVQQQQQQHQQQPFQQQQQQPYEAYGAASRQW